ncbi:unnamed protein product [Oppiella nova]|uniref:Uncharacterized protein n=1 Tax=Oppiella nova TaxID=334625 RepID=A0A7R9QZ59_9ACAR|nr:unnamed protein product [Oppiella nova]CAG2179792.1 unnamed protein product [Oppiella nova]
MTRKRLKPQSLLRQIKAEEEEVLKKKKRFEDTLISHFKIQRSTVCCICELSVILVVQRPHRAKASSNLEVFSGRYAVPSFISHFLVI